MRCIAWPSPNFESWADLSAHWTCPSVPPFVTVGYMRTQGRALHWRCTRSQPCAWAGMSVRWKAPSLLHDWRNQLGKHPSSLQRIKRWGLPPTLAATLMNPEMPTSAPSAMRQKPRHRSTPLNCTWTLHRWRLFHISQNVVSADDDLRWTALNVTSVKQNSFWLMAATSACLRVVIRITCWSTRFHQHFTQFGRVRRTLWSIRNALRPLRAMRSGLGLVRLRSGLTQKSRLVSPVWKTRASAHKK